MSAEAYLADTHILLWALNDDRQLSERYRILLNSNAIVYASVASIWEISIKRSLGKLTAPPNLCEVLPAAAFPILAIRPEHAECVADLKHHHRDPFDRMLVAQAQLEGLTILSVDPHFSNYDVKVF